ncbi:hypothetical protein ACLB2K_016133 [Fragaria x ananassa]
MGLKGVSVLRDHGFFLIPLAESENSSLDADADAICSSNPDYQYDAAVNDMVDPSHRKTNGGPNLSCEASQQGTKRLVSHKEIQSKFKALHHSQFLSESQNMTGSPIQSPLSPIPHQQAEVDDRKIGQFQEGQCDDQNTSKTVVSTSAVGQNFLDFDGFPREMPVHKERTFLLEMPVSQPEDLISQLSGSIGSHHSMPHALSDSKLQENGGRSAYSSQEGINLSHPLNFIKAELSLLQNSGISQENLTQLHESIDPCNPWVQNKLHDTELVGLPPLGRRLNLPNSSSCLESLGNDDVSGDIHDKFPTVTEKDFMTLELPNKLSEKDIFLHHDDTFYGERSPAIEAACQKRLPNVTSTFASGVVVPAASESKPLVGYMVNKDKLFQGIGIPKFPAYLLALDNTCDGSSLDDLLSGLSNGPNSHEAIHPQSVASQHDIGFQESLLTSSVNSYPVTVLNDLEFQKCDHMVLQKPIQNAALKREVSLFDDDFGCYPAASVENLSLNGENVALTQTQAQTVSNQKGQLDSVITAEDLTSGVTLGIQSSSVASPHVAEESISDLLSPTATEVESIIQESECEDDKGDIGDKNDSFSDAIWLKWKPASMVCRSLEMLILKNYGNWDLTDFWREAQNLSNLHHPNVVAIYGIVPDGAGGTLATVAEYMVNGSLKHALVKKDRSLDQRKKLIIAMDAAFGMEYLHSKDIVHFDLKCDNLLVNDLYVSGFSNIANWLFTLEVGDFGLSRIKRSTLVSGGVRGTLPWMAPELLNGSSSRVSEKVDVFSFGISMWEILTGEELYANMHCGAIIGGIVKNTLRPPIPQWCDSEWKMLMEECWSADPESRPSFTEITI